MSHKSQSANMVTLAKLLKSDLGYIHGPRESGPNGDKSMFLSKGRAFLSALGKDLGFVRQEVRVNKAGIAVSGEVYLTGCWDEDSGLYLWLEQDVMGKHCVCYRTRPTYGHNHFITLDFLAKGDYPALLNKLLAMKGECHGRKVA